MNSKKVRLKEVLKNISKDDPLIPQSFYEFIVERADILHELRKLYEAIVRWNRENR